jgi:transposase-like protein
MSVEFKTLIELVRKFPDEKSCHQYLAAQRWHTGEIICPHDGCGHNQCYVFTDGIRYKCKKCKTQFTAKTKTFMEGSKLGTIKWILSMYLNLHKKGISSIQLSKDIGVTQKTAWFVLQRLRLAYGKDQSESEKLDGVVEIDETFVGGKAQFKHKNKRIKYLPGRGWSDKTPVLGMLQRGGNVKALVIPNVLMLTLKKAIYPRVKGGSELMTDGFAAYRPLGLAYNMKAVDHGRGHYAHGEIHTNSIEGFWSQFKKGIKSTYHKTTRKHLQKYVDEFVFKYNKRNFGMQEQIECVISNMVCRLKYKELTAA